MARKHSTRRAAATTTDAAQPAPAPEAPAAAETSPAPAESTTTTDASSPQLTTFACTVDAGLADVLARLLANRCKGEVQVTIAGETRSFAPGARAVPAEVPADVVFAGERERLSLAASMPIKRLSPPTKQQQAVIDLCTRPGGATASDLYGTTTSSQGVPWRDVVANVARRFRYAFGSYVDEARKVHYCLTPIDADAGPANAAG